MLLAQRATGPRDGNSTAGGSGVADSPARLGLTSEPPGQCDVGWETVRLVLRGDSILTRRLQPADRRGSWHRGAFSPQSLWVVGAVGY